MEKLFFTDAYITDFDAAVTECQWDEGRKLFRLALNRTAFFPEGGGQPADKGFLTVPDVSEQSAVEDVQLEDDIVWHYLHTQIPAGTLVHGCIDRAQRFDFMQQHSGEHILSGLIHSRFGYDNVGFHLGLEEVTLDTSGELTEAQLNTLEQEANEIIWHNLPILTSFPSPEALPGLTYRSKLALTENVRLVEIPGVDLCACCAPHVSHTGEIGILKITGFMRHRGGMRLNILCGMRALKDYTAKSKSISSISVSLSARQDALAEAVKRLCDDNRQLKNRYILLENKLLELSLSALPSPDEQDNAILFSEELNDISMRNAVNRLTNAYHGYCGIFTGNDRQGYRFIIGSSAYDCRSLAQALRETFHAKCGGSAPMIQGSITAARTSVEEYFYS